jgi:hypothetical protein
VFELAEEALDQVSLSIEPLAEARLPFTVGFGWDVGRGALLLDKRADAIGVISLVGEDDGAGTKVVEQPICDLNVMRLPGCQPEPDREALCIDDSVDLGREPASAATEAMICTPLFAVAACWCARTEVLSIICMSPSCAAVMASISRSHTPAFRHLVKRL